MLKATTARAWKAGIACILSATFVFAPALADAKSPPLFSEFFGLSGAKAAKETKEATEAPSSSTHSAPIALAQLPRQGRVTYALIHQGGPFPYDKDGTVFGNRERLLPAHKRGYYREYTVKTPGSRNRGARRIVCGGQPVTPSVCYYTDDHYNSFRPIAP
ncbi:MAG: ribonuclease [Giesbergeria sp.]|nr:ribonuclease [Giesbergeria sp.]